MRCLLICSLVLLLVFPAFANEREKKDLALQPAVYGSRGLLDCGGAAELVCDPSANTGDNTGEANNVVNYSCVGYSENGGDIVYYFTLVSETRVRITMTPVDADLDLFLLGSCDEGNCLAYSAGSGEETIIECLAAGTYYVVVDGYGSSYPGAEGPFSIALFCDDCPTEPDLVQGGETCAEAVNLCDHLIHDAFHIAYDCTGFADDYDEDWNCGFWGSSGAEMVYSVCLEAGGTIDITQTGDVDMVLWMVEDCDDLTTCVTGSDNCCTGAAEFINYTSSAGGRYFIMVDGYSMNPVGTIYGTITGCCNGTATETSSWGRIKRIFR